MTGAEIIGTNPDFIKMGIRGMEPTIEEIIRSATSELQVIAYVFTPQAIEILNLIERAAEAGIRVTIVVNNLSNQNPLIQEKLRKIALIENARIVDFVHEKKRQLHAKVIIADRKVALVGSANFTWGGLYSNYEVGIKVEGEAAWKLAEMTDYFSNK
ncbi:MAG: phospholipase D-like domain-containing protein [Nitrososphaerota archaeon]|jgi:cardiolipin synthase|nr:phospholipase D-like domain-containing protein [Nitrososphaerota archaeon]